MIDCVTCHSRESGNPKYWRPGFRIKCGMTTYLIELDGLLARNDEKQPKLNILARESLPIGLARLAVQQRVLWHVCSFCVARYQAAYFPSALLLRCHLSLFQNRDQKRETAAYCESFNPMLPQQPTACRGMDSISRRFCPFPHLKAQLRLSAGNVLESV